MNYEHSTEIAIKESDLVIKEPCGYGSTGRVYRGFLRVDSPPVFKLVAVKEIRLIYNETVKLMNKQMLEDNKYFVKLNHPNVIGRIGLCERSDKTFLIVMEFAAGGCLFNYSEDHNGLSLTTLVNWALQIVNGMIYIHNNRMLHCDLKSRNILLSVYPRNQVEETCLVTLKVANISTFSLSGTASHMAPEAMKNQTSKKSDVWSFGVVLWEMLYGKQPFKGLEPLQIIYKVGLRRQTLQIDPDTCPNNTLANLIKSCWIYDERERPDFYKIMQTLLDIQESL